MISDDVLLKDCKGCEPVIDTMLDQIVVTFSIKVEIYMTLSMSRIIINYRP